MAKYKVSYKVLSEQGKELQSLAKLVNAYGEKVSAIRGRLGEDQMLAEIRNNLTKFTQQLEESRAILNLAGELLSKSVDSYTQTESRGVKKVDNTRAHKRDFYKNPVVVASAGGAAATAAPAAGTTINYTETTNVTYTETANVYTEPAAVEATPVVTQTAAAAPVVEAAPAAQGAGAAVGAGALGGAAAAGAVMGAAHLKKKRDSEAAGKQATPGDSYDPDAELAEALARVKRLEEQL